ncbi:sulfide/dihydroorotate dehydrogenase-like FAD/NAD-binding protein, partial [bacterium]|nr:sulfide/dihydroorotate dehydrogenase-like FAD/NAD-binding protein [bacterium]
YGRVVVIGGGVGIAPAHPIAQAMKKAGNTVISILGGRTKELIIMEKEMKDASAEVIITTDDGSYGNKGFVTDALQKLIDDGPSVDLVVAVGPPIMMKFVSKMTKNYEIKTIVSLNTIMVDGTGMCGCCRVSVGGETKFVCVDGPEFDGHKVDFDEMMHRIQMYKPQEKESMDKFLSE